MNIPRPETHIGKRAGALSPGDVVAVGANELGRPWRGVVLQQDADRAVVLELEPAGTGVGARLAVAAPDLESGGGDLDAEISLGHGRSVCAASCIQVDRLTPAKRAELLRSSTRGLAQLYARHVYEPRPAFVAGETVIPATAKLIGAAEICAIVDSALDGWLTSGRFNVEFEASLARTLGVPHALTLNSGSSANLAAFAALTSPALGARAIVPGDEVICVAASFPTTVNPVLQFGAIPVFVDIEVPTYNIDADQIEAALSPRTRAIVLAHTLGNPFDVGAVEQIARRHGLWLIEDCCDALGSTYGGRQVGTFGDLATLSFYPAHHITMGEGGAVFTRHAELKRIVESFRDWGRDCYCPPGRENTCGKRYCWQLGDLPLGYDHKYIYSHLGFNLKITDMQAACALAQLARLEGFIAARKRNYRFLHGRLKCVEEFLILPEATPNADPSWFGFPLTLRAGAGVRRVELLGYLDQYRIGTRLLFAGNMTRQPAMHGRRYRVHGQLARTDQAMNDTFWIGLHPALTEPMLEFVADKIAAFFGIGI